MQPEQSREERIPAGLVAISDGNVEELGRSTNDVPPAQTMLEPLEPEDRAIAGYGFAVFAIALWTMAQLPVDNPLVHSLPWMALVVIIIASFWFGYGPALFATSFGAVWPAYLMISEGRSFDSLLPQNYFTFAIYCAMAVGMVLLKWMVKRARRKKFENAKRLHLMGNSPVAVSEEQSPISGGVTE